MGDGKRKSKTRSRSNSTAARTHASSQNMNTADGAATTAVSNSTNNTSNSNPGAGAHGDSGVAGGSGANTASSTTSTNAHASGSNNVAGASRSLSTGSNGSESGGSGSSSLVPVAVVMFELVLFAYGLSYAAIQNFNIYRWNLYNYNTALVALTVAVLLKRLVLMYLAALRAAGGSVSLVREAPWILASVIILSTLLYFLVTITLLQSYYTLVYVAIPAACYFLFVHDSSSSSGSGGNSGGASGSASGSASGGGDVDPVTAAASRLRSIVYTAGEYGFVCGVVPLLLVENEYIYYDTPRCVLLVFHAVVGVCLLLLAHWLRAHYVELYCYLRAVDAWRVDRGPRAAPKAHPDWSAAKLYRAGDTVSHGGDVFICVADAVVGGVPSSTLAVESPGSTGSRRSSPATSGASGKDGSRRGRSRSNSTAAAGSLAGNVGVGGGDGGGGGGGGQRAGGLGAKLRTLGVDPDRCHNLLVTVSGGVALCQLAAMMMSTTGWPVYAALLLVCYLNFWLTLSTRNANIRAVVAENTAATAALEAAIEDSLSRPASPHFNKSSDFGRGSSGGKAQGNSPSKSKRTNRDGQGKRNRRG